MPSTIEELNNIRKQYWCRMLDLDSYDIEPMWHTYDPIQKTRVSSFMGKTDYITQRFYAYRVNFVYRGQRYSCVIYPKLRKEKSSDWISSNQYWVEDEQETYEEFKRILTEDIEGYGRTEQREVEEAIYEAGIPECGLLEG